MSAPVIYGTPFSTYVRSARMALREKGVDYRLVDVSVLGGEHKQPAHLARNPFGTVPAFEYQGIKLYETSAIVRYIDQVFPGASLTPDDAVDRAHMNQAMSIIDYHGYKSIILQVVAPRLFEPLLPPGLDKEATVATGRPLAELCLDELDRMRGDSAFLAGDRLSLADLYVLPVVHYLMLTPDRSLLESRPGLARWWEAMNQRPSVTDTMPQLG